MAVKHDRLLRLPEVKSLVGMSTASIWRHEKNGTFPHRLKIGHWLVAWRESEIQEWIKRLPTAGE